MALLYINKREVIDLNKFMKVFHSLQDIRDKYHVNDVEILRSMTDSSMTVLMQFSNMDMATAMKNDPEFLSRMKLVCACGEKCACASQNSDLNECKCDCASESSETSLTIFSKVQSCSNVTIKEKATLLVFQEADDFNKWNQVYGRSDDLFKKHSVVSRSVFSMPKNSKLLLVIYTFENIQDCVNMSKDSVLADRMAECCIMDSNFFDKIVMENVK